ncbi:MAG: TRAM domain-containing protein [Vicinamibacteria bacterium]|nr:TRAM domain-containing protein [Vicinamibacteria bacterium]
MWLFLFRLCLLVLLAVSGFLYSPFPGRPLVGLGLGVAVALAVIALELKLRSVRGDRMIGALVGGVTGLIGARLLWGALTGIPMEWEHFVHVLLVIFLVYIGIVIGSTKAEWFEPAHIVASFKDTSRLHQYKVLDTSVIIDGRIADICVTGFLDGTLVVPQFVLRELQQVADSSDSLKRNRGRRGLDILQKMQKMTNVRVQIVETDYPEVRDVDLKLIELALHLSGKIVTNDFNLNKVAQLRGVHVLNINELANSLKPVVLPGEVMRVFVIKEGKEAGQGVGYLDDGTMVVVDQAKRALGRTIEVVVTSVLQTTAGKMIFCRWPEAAGEENGRRDARTNERRDYSDDRRTPSYRHPILPSDHRTQRSSESGSGGEDSGRRRDLRSNGKRDQSDDRRTPHYRQPILSPEQRASRASEPGASGEDSGRRERVSERRTPSSRHPILAPKDRSSQSNEPDRSQGIDQARTGVDTAPPPSTKPSN